MLNASAPDTGHCFKSYSSARSSTLGRRSLADPKKSANLPNNGQKKKLQILMPTWRVNSFDKGYHFFFGIQVHQFVGSGKKNFIDILCFFD